MLMKKRITILYLKNPNNCSSKKDRDGYHYQAICFLQRTFVMSPKADRFCIRTFAGELAGLFDEIFISFMFVFFFWMKINSQNPACLFGRHHFHKTKTTTSRG